MTKEEKKDNGDDSGLSDVAKRIKEKTKNPEHVVVVDGKVVEGKVETIGQAYISRGGGGNEATPKTSTQIKKEVKERAEAKAEAQKIAEELAKDKEKFKENIKVKETKEQMALILQASQQEIKGTSKFEALRSHRLAQQKQTITEPAKAEALLMGGRIKVTGTVAPFIETPFITSYENIILEKPISKKGISNDFIPSSVIIEGRQIEDVAMKKELTRIKKSKQDFQDKYYVKKTVLVPTIPGGTAIPTQITKRQKTHFSNIPYYDEFTYKKDLRKIEQSEKDYMKKYYPYRKTSDISISTEKKIIDNSLNIKEASKLMESIPEDVSPLQEAVALTIGKKTTTLKADSLISPYIVKSINIEKTTITPEIKTERIVYEQLRQKLYETRRTGTTRDIINIVSTASFIGAGGTAINLLSKAPFMSFTTKKGAFAVLKYAYVGTETINVGFGSYDISKGNIDEGTKKITGVISRGVGVSVGIVGAKTIQAIGKDKLIKKERLINIEKTDKLNKEEKDFLKTITKERTKEEIKYMGELIGTSTVKKSALIDINKLKTKQLEKLSKLIKSEKIKSEFELDINPTNTKEVGFSFKGRGAIIEQSSKQQQQKFIEAFMRGGRKSAESTQKRDIIKMKKSTSELLEKKIRSEMQRTGKTAKEIYGIMSGDKAVLREIAKKKPFSERIENLKSIDYTKREQYKKSREIFKKHAEEKYINKLRELAEKSNQPKKTLEKKIKESNKILKKLKKQEKKKIKNIKNNEIENMESIEYTFGKTQKINTPKEKPPDLTNLGGFQSMDAGSQKLLLPEHEILRGLKPVERVVFPSIKKLESVATLKGVIYPTKTESIPSYNAIPVLNTKADNESVKTDTNIMSKAVISLVQKPILNTVSATSVLSSTNIKTSALTSQTTKQELLTEQKTITSTTTVQVQKQKTIQEQATKTKTSTVVKIPNIITPTIKIPNLKFDIPFEKPEGSMFTAEVRKKGKFIEVGTFENVSRAFSRARREVSTTASASLRVRGPFGYVSSSYGLDSRQFRRGEEPGVFIEKRGKRIKSSGELGEITYKGLASLRTKQLFSKNKKRGIFS